MSETDLRQSCHTFFSGHRPRTPAEDFAAMARWCERTGARHDTYGAGGLVADFERRIADLLGFEAGLFCVTGILAQTVALRLACQARGSRLVALHPTAHILRHECSNYQLLDHFQILEVGDVQRVWTVEDLRQWPDRFGAALYELPMREIGGQLPAWADLEAVKAHCADQGIHLHLDGARLWEAAAGYDRAPAEIARGFDSAYVSFYKGIGGLGGCMLLGRKAFVDLARVWTRRQGGDVFRRTPYAASAAMQFDQRLADLPACLARTRWLYGELRRFPEFRPNPAEPQCNMLHLYLPADRARALAARDRIAAEEGVWMFNNAAHGPLPEQSRIEWYVGDSLLAMPDARAAELLERLTAGLKV